MDANREQSDRCFEFACAHLRKGEKLKAIKFLQKAIRLYSGNRAAADLLLKLETTEHSTQNGFYENGESETHTRSRFASSKSQPNFNKHAKTKNRRQQETPPSSSDREKDSASRGTKRTGSASPGPGAHHKTASQPQLGVDYTQEQLEMVQRVRRCKDYYEILSVTKEFTEIELKKQYRKLALQFHPDKNNAPGATEAFKAIGNAYAVLSEPKKRERYDMYGSADSSSQSSHQRNQYYEYDYSRGFEADMTAEEIFNMFFGGGFPQGNLRRRPTGHFQQQSTERENRNDSGFGLLLQLTPLLILILLSVFSQLFVPDPPFSLTRTQKYPHERQTSELKVTYFVKPDFLKNHQNNIRGVEQQVEEAYIEDLRNACSRERTKRDTVLWSAKLYSDANLYERGQQMPTHSCDRLSKIYRTLGV